MTILTRSCDLMNEWVREHNNHRYYFWAEKLMLHKNWASQKKPTIQQFNAKFNCLVGLDINANLMHASTCQVICLMIFVVQQQGCIKFVFQKKTKSKILASIKIGGNLNKYTLSQLDLKGRQPVLYNYLLVSYEIEKSMYSNRTVSVIGLYYDNCKQCGLYTYVAHALLN